jgi:Zn-dependent membrane protease YugP
VGDDPGPTSLQQVQPVAREFGINAAAAILRQEGISDVEIVAHDQLLGDHYDPMHKRVVLSGENFYATSVAALGVAAHECGHAIQHKQAYAPLQWRMASVGLTICQSDRTLAAPAGDVHRFPEHGYGTDPNGQRLGHIDAV